MSHYFAVVELRVPITPARGGLPAQIEPILVEEALESAMKPYFSDCAGRALEDDTSRWTEHDEPVPAFCEHKRHEWDWYVIGGRFVDFFQSVREPAALPFMGEDAASRFNRSPVHALFGGLKNPEPVPERHGWDVILKGDVDWEAMAAKKMQEAGGWWDAAAANPGDPMNSWQYGVKEGEDRNSYIVRQTKGRTYTILTADGRWMEKETYVPGKGDMDLGHFEQVEDWDRVWDETIGAMPADSVLVAVDFHN
jgi:hypothetical protein